MRELSFLIMILGIASAANAAVMISVNDALDVEEITIMPSDTVTIDIYDTVPASANFYLDFYNKSEAKFELSNARLGEHVGSLSSFNGPYDGSIWGLDSWEVFMS